jgi:hypothetical protein
MKRLVLTVIAAWAWGGLDGKPAQAQFTPTRPQTSPFYQPPVSPYLNILRGGPLGMATGYYTLTRPQFQMGNQLLNLQSGLLNLQQQAGVLNLQQAALLSGITTTGTPTGLATTPASLGLTTGHPTSFFNYGHYYNFPNVQGRSLGR